MSASGSEPIEDALGRGTAYRKVAEKYGRSSAALSRHWQLHMRVRAAVVAIPAAAHPAEAGAPVVALVRELRELREGARQIRVREELRRPDVAVRAMVQERQNLALEQRMRERQGEPTWLADPKTAEFLRLVMKMLERHPETFASFQEELETGGRGSGLMRVRRSGTAR